jgi:hypothetical protein
MPTYEYVDLQGKRHSFVQEFSEAVPIDEWTVIDGISLRRVASIPSVSVSGNYRVTGWSLPNDHPSIDAVGLARDADGNPLFDGKRDIDRFNKDALKKNEKDPSVPAYEWDKA